MKWGTKSAAMRRPNRFLRLSTNRVRGGHEIGRFESRERARGAATRLRAQRRAIKARTPSRASMRVGVNRSWGSGRGNAPRRDICARWPVMARGGTADPGRLETATGRRTVAEAAADIPRGSRRRRRVASTRWGAKRDGDETESRGTSRTSVAAARVAGSSPDLRPLARVNPLSHPLPPLPLPRACRDVLGRRSSVAYSPGLWPVRWSAPATISRWSSSARDASARPRSPFVTSRTSSTTSTSPRYRWLSPTLPLPRRFSVCPIEPTLHHKFLFSFQAQLPSHT